MTTRATFTDHGDHVTLDLHGHTTGYVVSELAQAVIAAAWRRGYRSVKLIHGSPDVQSRRHADCRGGTKWGLRQALNRGDWTRWAWNRRSVKHSGLEANSGALVLALRPNPAPEPGSPWPPVEEPAFEYEGPRHRARH